MDDVTGRKRPPVLSFRGAEGPRAWESAFVCCWCMIIAFEWEAESNYGNTLPYTMSIKFSHSLSLFCFQITLLSLSLSATLVPSPEKKLSFLVSFSIPTLNVRLRSALCEEDLEPHLVDLWKIALNPHSTLGFCVGGRSQSTSRKLWLDVWFWTIGFGEPLEWTRRFGVSVGGFRVSMKMRSFAMMLLLLVHSLASYPLCFGMN